MSSCRQPGRPRPVRRLECLPGGWNEQRPCPFIECRYHLAHPDIRRRRLRRNGTLQPPRAWNDGLPTCALDLVEDGTRYERDQVAELLGVSVEGVRWIEVNAGKFLRFAHAEQIHEAMNQSPNEVDLPRQDAIQEVYQQDAKRR